MKTFTNIPKHIEDALDHERGTTSRRDLLKSAGMLVVSLGAARKSFVSNQRNTRPPRVGRL